MCQMQKVTPPPLAAAEGHLDCLRLLVYYKNEPAEVIGARNDKVSQNRCTKAARVYSKVVFVFVVYLFVLMKWSRNRASSLPPNIL